MSQLGQETAKNPASIVMIVHQEQPHFLSRSDTIAHVTGRFRHRFVQEIEKNSKRCALAFARTFHADCSAMQLKQRLGNAEPKTQSAEAPGNGTLALMERLKDIGL